MTYAGKYTHNLEILSNIKHLCIKVFFTSVINVTTKEHKGAVYKGILKKNIKVYFINVISVITGIHNKALSTVILRNTMWCM